MAITEEMIDGLSFGRGRFPGLPLLIDIGLEFDHVHQELSVRACSPDSVRIEPSLIRIRTEDQ